MMTEPSSYPHENAATHSVVAEPAMVMGFLPSALHAKLRRLAAELGVSQAHLVSKYVREALQRDRRAPARELQ